jgi:hypothetical protein
MKNKKLLALAASAALIANLALGVASAETTTSDQQINGGSLTIVATPASVNFSNLNVSTATQTNTTTFGADSVHIQDTRSTSSAFTFTLTTTDFQQTTGSNFTFDLTNLATHIVNDADHLEAVGTSDCSTGITLLNGGSAKGFSDADNDSISDAESVMTGDTRIRVMECLLTPIIQVDVPGSTASGTYRSTFTWGIS